MEHLVLHRGSRRSIKDLWEFDSRPNFPSPKILELEPGSGQRIEIHYAGISLGAAERVRFQHRLDGYDHDWSETTDLPLAIYTNLRPGSYRFRLKAANPNGIWNLTEASLSFVIQPHFWQTGLFLGLLAGVLIAFLALVHYRRLLALRKAHLAQEQQSLAAERTR